jgi:hypothetical protein
MGELRSVIFEKTVAVQLAIHVPQDGSGAFSLDAARALADDE